MKRILMIEDDTDLQEGLSISLQSEGYQTLGAGSMKEGLEIFEAGGGGNFFMGSAGIYNSVKCCNMFGCDALVRRNNTAGRDN